MRHYDVFVRGFSFPTCINMSCSRIRYMYHALAAVYCTKSRFIDK